MKNYIHARLGDEERAQLEALKAATGASESALVKRGLRLAYEIEVRQCESVLQAAGKRVGKYRGPKDLSSNKKHFEGFGE